MSNKTPHSYAVQYKHEILKLLLNQEFCEIASSLSCSQLNKKIDIAVISVRLIWRYHQQPVSLKIPSSSVLGHKYKKSAWSNYVLLFWKKKISILYPLYLYIPKKTSTWSSLFNLCLFLEATMKNFHFVLIVAPRVDKSGTACCRKDLIVAWAFVLEENTYSLITNLAVKTM